MAIYGDILEEQIQYENWKQEWILSHLQYIPMDSEQRESIRCEFEHEVSQDRLQELYEEVNRNLPDRIENGLNYNQTDIIRKLVRIEMDERK